MKQTALEAFGEKEDTTNKHRYEINENTRNIEKKTAIQKIMAGHENDEHYKNSREVDRGEQTNKRRDRTCLNIETYLRGARFLEQWKLQRGFIQNSKEKLNQKTYRTNNAKNIIRDF